MTKYVALLRGINVGGKTVPMKQLTQLFQKLGYEKVKTLLASGNVLFSSNNESKIELVNEIEEAILRRFDFDVVVQVRTLAEIKQLAAENPFQALTPNPDIHWYVTFLPAGTSESLPKHADNSYKLLEISRDVLFSTLDRRATQTTDFMTFLDRHYGKEITTRNWNTLLKLSQLE